MSDSNNTEPQDPTEAAKPKQTAGQQMLVWFLIIVVGVLFGMGPVLATLREAPPPEYADVSQDVALAHNDIEAKINDVLFGTKRASREWNSTAYTIWMSRLAEREGLMPKGEALDAVTDAWLDEPVNRWDDRTRRSVLLEYQSSDKGVRLDAVKLYLQVEEAATNLQQRYVQVPAIPQSMARDLAAVSGDRVSIEEVTLSTAPFVAEFREAAGADEAAIEEAFNELEFSRFSVPAKRVVTVFAANPADFADQIVVTDAQIEARYKADKEQKYLLPPPADQEVAEGEEPKPNYRELDDELKTEITAIIRQEHAVDLAAQLYNRFESLLHAKVKGGSQPANEIPTEDIVAIVDQCVIAAADRDDLSADVKMAVTAGVAINDAEGEMLIPGFGEAKRNGSLFAGDVSIGALFDARIQLGEADELMGPGMRKDAPSMRLLLRVDERVEATTKALGDEGVREEVIDYVAGRLAWGKLLESAEQMATNASEGGLKAFFEGKEDRWGAVTERSVPGLEEFAAPPEEVDGDPGEAQTAIALLDDGITLASAPRSEAGLPQVRLVRAVAYVPGAPQPNSLARNQQMGRGMIQQYQASEFRQELQRRLQEGE